MVQTVAVLVVEDEAIIRLGLEDTLQEGGYSPVTACTGEEARECLQTVEVRALVTDVNLGTGLSGWDLARIARELFPDLPVIYVTSVSRDEWSSQGVPNSIMIAKPFASAQVVTAISQLLNAPSDGSAI
jgi:DNA-binding response OmpR family regulator